jgi:hypothetical protein
MIGIQATFREIRSSRYLLLLGGVTLFVLAFPMVVWQLGFLPDNVRDQARRIFSVGLENNIGAWWSGILLFLAGVHALDGYRRYWEQGFSRLALAWLIVACTIMALSLDEVGSLHERINRDLGWQALVPFGVIIIASVTWASWQMWSDSFERKGILLIAVAFGLFAATAFNEYLEHAIAWPASVRPWRAGFEEGIELVGMLLLVAVAVHNSGGAFGAAGSGETRRPCLWFAHSMPVWVLLAVLAASPLFAVITTGLHDAFRGRPADWLASMMFFLAGLAAWRPALCSVGSPKYPGRVGVGLLLVAASAGSVALYPQWHIDVGSLEVNLRLFVIFVLLLGVAAFTWLRESHGGLRVTYLWLSVAGVAGILSATSSVLLLQQMATQGVAILAYAVAAPQVCKDFGNLARFFKRKSAARS